MAKPPKPGIEIDRDRHEVFVDGKEARLAPKEYDLLIALIDSGKTMGREPLSQSIGLDFEAYPRSVDNAILRLRKKIGAGFIGTVPHRGYRWDGDKGR